MSLHSKQTDKKVISRDSPPLFNNGPPPQSKHWLFTALLFTIILLPLPPPPPKQMDLLQSSYTTHKKSDGVRVPSYTDRILFHSLPGVRAKVHLLHYGMCDQILGSDHRPVSAAFGLLVNRKVRRKRRTRKRDIPTKKGRIRIFFYPSVLAMLGIVASQT